MPCPLNQISFSFRRLTETHEIAEAQKEKNSRLREAFGISNYFVEGSSFDPERLEKEKVAKEVAEKEAERKRLEEKASQRRSLMSEAKYGWVHTPSPSPERSLVKKEKKRKSRRFVFCLASILRCDFYMRIVSGSVDATHRLIL